MNAEHHARIRSAISLGLTGLLVSAASVAAGSAAARLVGPSIRNRYFPWITGRSLGIGAYLALCSLVILGTWMRHPWRLRKPIIHAEARLRAHSALAIATVVLVVGHLSSLALDKYAGVGWWGALVPGKSQFKTLPVALGVAGFWVMVLLTVTAGLAGRRGTRHWLVLHRVAALTFASVWLHGVLSGTDTWRLRLLYLITGAVIIFLVATRAMASAPAVRTERFIVASPVQDAASSDAADADLDLSRAMSGLVL